MSVPGPSIRSRARTPSPVLHLAAAMAAAVLLAPAPAGAQGLADALDDGALDALSFRHIGPLGNRFVAVAGVPGDPTTYLAGAASGGLWKTEDGGLSWRPVFDDQPVHSVGALAISPADASVAWAGTGEPFIRSNVSIGNGVWKSTDGGDTWTHVGLEGTGRISRIVAHPTDPDVAWVAALGHGYSPQPERGVYRTTDGGETWEKVLFVDENTGASDLVMHPTNPRILMAGTWQIDIKTWGRWSGGPGSGIWITKDGGDTWTRVEDDGLPAHEVGKVALCTTADDPDRVYALIETGDGIRWDDAPTDSGELWRSDDGGRDWELVNHNQDLGGRSAYYSRCAVSPDDADEAYFLAAAYSRTTDGGRSATEIQGDAEPGWDHHDMWIDPTDADRMIVASDGGIAVSTNRGRSWHRIQLPVAQMYHVTVDDAIPYHVLGNRQDGPSFRGPSDSRSGDITRGHWRQVGGGESGFATPDPEDPSIVWSSASGAGARGGIVTRWNEETGQYRRVEVWPESTGGWPAEDLRYRFQWTFPLLVSPHDRNTVYVTSQHVHRTTDGGQTWEVISPDLTTNDKSKQRVSGGLTPDNIGVEYCCVIYAFDESPLERGLFWAGTNDGLVHVSRDGGGTWTEVTDNLPGLPPLGTVRNVHASRHDPARAYVTVDFHQVGGFDPFVYRTDDYGASWTKITDGVDDSPLSYARFVLEDPVRPGLLYLGTENALYVSFDDGGSWRSLMTNLPPAPMYGLAFQRRFNDLVVGTYGRGFWILDDVTPLQDLTPAVAASPVHLFETNRNVYRLLEVTGRAAMFDDWTEGDGPEGRVPVDYWLDDGAEEVTIRIADASGETVREMEGTGRTGLNRVWWDLWTDPQTPEIRMRTRPPHAPWVPLNDEGWREATEGWRVRWPVPPGAYTVTLAADGEERTARIEVLQDPASEGTPADIDAQIALLREVVEDTRRAAELVNRLEWTRRQLYDLRAVLADREGHADLLDEIDGLDGRLREVEGRLVQLRLTGTGQDGVRWPTRLVGKLGYLGQGLVNADFPPTDAEREVHAVLRERLAAVARDVEALFQGPVADFNRTLRERSLAPVVSDGG